MPDGTTEEEDPEFTSFDPTDLGTTPPGLPVEPSGSGGDQDPHPVTDGNPGVETDEEPLPEFDPRHRDALEGLLFLGALQHKFEWANHSFVIKNLTTDELLAVALLQKPYQGSMGEMKAYAGLIVGASVVAVDGKGLPVLPVEMGDNPVLTMVQERFNYVTKRWFPPTIDKVFEEYLILEATVAKVIEALSRAVGNGVG